MVTIYKKQNNRKKIYIKRTIQVKDRDQRKCISKILSLFTINAGKTRAKKWTKKKKRMIKISKYRLKDGIYEKRQNVGKNIKIQIKRQNIGKRQR